MNDNVICLPCVHTGAMPEDLPCPVCGASEGTEAQLRRHVMVEHRKSDLAALLVGDVSAGEDPLLA